MKVGVVIYHKDIDKIYDSRWVDKCLESIKNQTFSDYQIYEINYAADMDCLIKANCYQIELSNYAEAMNFIISKAFEDGCDYVFNVNLDDYYHPTRFEKQLEKLKEGYDIVSSDFCYIDEDNNITHHKNICKHGDIKENLLRNHNVIAHPAVAMSKNFWNSNRYDITKTPQEDLELWKVAIQNGYKFYIIDEELLYYRIHEKQVSNVGN